jgi:hypothetical protein
VALTLEIRQQSHTAVPIYLSRGIVIIGYGIGRIFLCPPFLR